jgi:hypothetical protein
MCDHLLFRANVNVTRMEETGTYSADISINCHQCGMSFDFVGAPVGCVDHYRPITNLAGNELRVPIVPQGQKQKPGLPCIAVSANIGELQ